jgi:hypothetical protein
MHLPSSLSSFSPTTKVVFVKIKGLRALLKAGISGLFIDADVVLFSVPQLPPLDSFDLVAQMERFDMPCAIRAQESGADERTLHRNCALKSINSSGYAQDAGKNINSGQLGMTPSNATIKLLEDTIECGMKMKSQRGNQFCLKSVLQQNVAYKSIRLVYLPNTYADHKWAKSYVDKVGFVTYHAHMAGNKSGKLAVLKRMMGSTG